MQSFVVLGASEHKVCAACFVQLVHLLHRIQDKGIMFSVHPQ